MIDINLIPTSLRKNGQENAALTINLPHEVLLGAGSGVVLLIVTVHLLLGAAWLVGFMQLSVHNMAWQKLLPDRTILDGINTEFKGLKSKTTMLSNMTTKEALRWAPKFNAISDALPRGLWIRKMALDKTGLTVEGSVVSKTRNEINTVESFLAALKQNDNFMKDFSSLEVNSIQRSKTNATEVADFMVIAKLK